MISRLDPPLTTKNGSRLNILGIARISTDHQDELSLQDQEQLYRQWLTEHTDFKFDLHCIAGRGSGEILDRAEMLEAEQAVASGEYDAVIAEDLGRILRRMQAYLFCEMCEDNDTRLFAINDTIDTAREDWRLNAIFASMRHEAYNRDTGKRIRRTLRNRFAQGGVVQCVIYGYIKPDGAKCDGEIQKDPDANAVYDEWFRRLEDGDSFAEVADWLNAEGVPVGPYSRSNLWNGTMVGRITRNPILKGVRVRNEKISKRVNKTGRRKSVKAPPEERLERECPHLAFIESDRYDHVIALLANRNAKYRRKTRNGCDTHRNLPRKRTRFPGQMIYCGICGRLYVFGGHGRREQLMCNGAREHKCWNGATVSGPLAAERIASDVMNEIEGLPDFEPAAREAILAEAEEADKTRQRELRKLKKEEQEIDGAIRGLLNFICNGDSSDRVREELQRKETELASLRHGIKQLERHPTETIQLPNMPDLRRTWRESVAELAAESWDFYKLMRKLITRIEVMPHQLVDGGHVVLRARVRLQLANILPDDRLRDGLQSSWKRILTIDLFEPPQREVFRKQVLVLREKMTERETAKALGITHTAAQRAAALQRMMDAMGLRDPYVALNQPPDDCGKLYRHKNARYRFEPLDEPSELWLS